MGQEKTPRTLKKDAGQFTSDTTAAPTDNANTESKRSKIAGYDRKELARRMKLDPDDQFAIRKRREFIKVRFMWRGQVLNRPFENWDTTVMYKLVRTVNPEMQAQFSGRWPFDLTFDLIHTTYLDKVRNTKARERAQTKTSGKQSSSVPSAIAMAPKIKKNQSRPVVTNKSDESETML